MAGQGFHLGIGKAVANRLDDKLFQDKRFITGVLSPYPLGMMTGSRRSHFTGGEQVLFILSFRVRMIYRKKLNLLI